MKLKKSVMAGVILWVCAGVAEAGFFESFVNTLAENRAVEQAPDCTLSADEAYARSIELLSDGRQAEAEDLIKSALKSHRDDIRILFAKAVLERSRWDKASANVWFAMARKAPGKKHLSDAAWLSVKLDRHEAAEENMAELIRLSDENPDEIFLLWIGAIQCREQDMGELGRQRYEKLLKKFRLGPVMVHHTYANILAETLDDDYETALEHRILAVSMEARSWSLYGMGNTLVSMGKNEWGCAVLARVVRRNPYDAKYANRLGDALYNMERYAEAEEKYRKSLHLNPKSGWTWDALGDCLKNLGKKEDMFKAYQRAVELGYNWALVDLGLCYHEGNGVGKNEQKAFDLYRLCADKTDSAHARRQLGVCYSEGFGVEKDLQKAQEWYERALKIKPDYANVLNSLAWDLATSKDKSLHDYPRAVKLAERAVALGMDRYNLDTLAVAYFKNKQYADAVQAQERLIAYWQSQNPGKPVPAGQLKRLERYKKLRQQAGESS